MAKLIGTDPNQVPTNGDLGDLAYQNKDSVKVEAFESNGIDDNATSTAMTIDSSGNLLVGKTAVSVTTVGAELRPDGQLIGVRDGGVVQYLNRTTSDGDIAVFRKDGTTVGSIGTSSGDLTIGTAAMGLKFRDGNQDLIPWNTTTNGVANGVFDLGDGSNRWKDLYLSGGIVFGSTGGSVTSKTLDDYEEGTFSVTMSSGASTTPSLNGGKYTKIGNVVYINAQFTIAATQFNGTAIELSGLPFTASSRCFMPMVHQARVQYQSSATHYWYIESGTTVAEGRYILANSATISDLLTENAYTQPAVTLSGFYYTS